MVTVSYSVYWISKNNSLNYLSEGYVGISCNIKRRFNEHKNTKSPSILSKSIKKYGWNKLNKTILVENIDDELACLIEEMLRPQDNMGWNIVKGGGLPPTLYGKKNALGNKSRTGIRKYTVICTDISTGKVTRLSGKQELLDAGFNPCLVYSCIAGRNKTHKNCEFKKSP
jgi:predicted GIY-YIG superfamily endonuclease